MLALAAGEKRVWLRVLPPDDAADVLQLAPVDERSDLAGQIDDVTRREVNALLAYKEEAAGGLMNPCARQRRFAIRAMALGEVRLRDWWRVIYRKFSTGLALRSILAAIMSRILIWQTIWNPYGAHYAVIALTVACSLVRVVLFGSIAGSTLPFVLRRVSLDR